MKKTLVWEEDVNYGPWTWRLLALTRWAHERDKIDGLTGCARLRLQARCAVISRPKLSKP